SAREADGGAVTDVLAAAPLVALPCPPSPPSSPHPPRTAGASSTTRARRRPTRGRRDGGWRTGRNSTTSGRSRGPPPRGSQLRTCAGGRDRLAASSPGAP